MKLPVHCCTLAPEKPFINTLAQWILEQYGEDAALLASALILLPTRRACRSLREAFLEATGGRPLLLPRMQPLGDIGEDMALSHFAAFDEAVPPAIPPLRRLYYLMRLVRDFKQWQGGDSAGRDRNIGQAAQLAQQLARLIDDVGREGLDFSGLSGLVPDELARHWQQTLDFLTIVSRQWPDILAEEGAIDPIAHRNQLLKATAAAWQRTPPPFPVIAAGSTGSQPATAELLAAIARLPQGRVILPGLDLDMPDSEWDLLGETHPQAGLKQLLKRIGCARGEVASLLPSAASPRTVCLRAILQPPEATSGWKELSLPLAEGLSGIRLLTADTLLDEARLIAIALREALETPGKTAALVTPDRPLARMVAAQMRRFNVAIDDSAGHPLADTPPGCFLRLVADMAASAASPAALLALLRHPLAAAAMETAQCRALSRRLEIHLLRGVRHAPGLDALRDAAIGYKDLAPFMALLAERMRPLTDCFGHKAVSLRRLLEAHMGCAQWLASTPDEDGGERLWAGEAGNSLAVFLAGLGEHADLLEEIDPLSYPGLLDALMAGEVFRPRFGLHPRLHILSPAEARMQRYDLIVLGGLNENTWPSAPEADPWMSRPMRAAFGLPAPERAIGQSAHDIYLLAAAPEVLLTRARKAEGAPTVPSRWLVRLEMLVKGLEPGHFAAMQANAYYERGRELLEKPQDMPAPERPQPVPPLAARPRQMRVTAIDTWLRDPYMIYAEYVLALRPLPPLDEEPDAADFGRLVHKALERFIGAWPQALPDKPYDALLDCGRAAFSDMLDRPAVACLWWPRFEAMAEWIIDRERERRGSVDKVMGELKGRWPLSVDGKPFTLTTRIDRLEIGRDGTITIADYKTGSVPADAAVERGLANQLPLEALIALHGALEPAIAMPAGISGLEYWKLAGQYARCAIEDVGAKRDEGIEAWLASAQGRLEDLIRRFDQPQTPYAAQGNPSLLPSYNHYDHLTRRDEWGEA